MIDTQIHEANRLRAMMGKPPMTAGMIAEIERKQAEAMAETEEWMAKRQKNNTEKPIDE